MSRHLVLRSCGSKTDVDEPVADFTRGDVALKYVKRGFALLLRHALTLLLIPLAASTLVTSDSHVQNKPHW